ncbi:hypothetical protein ACFY1J_05435 [Streptomyces sp. NPDC001406]|uniref:hypothetical protein n=1 Tax=Streptomyces sp. NPDC001406 TaxID=3364572 RepID=UPI00369E0A1D
MKPKPPSDDRQSRLIISVAVGVIVLALVILVALLVDHAVDDDSDSSPGRCAPALAGTVDPVTCQPYGGIPAGTTNSSKTGSTARKPAVPAPKAPAAKAPAAPKAPAPAAPKAPAAPPRISLGKR